MARQDEFVEDAVGPFYDADGARTVLGAAPHQLDALVAASRVLALTTGDRTVVLPAAQFRTDGSPAPGLRCSPRPAEAGNQRSLDVGALADRTKR